MAVIKGTQSRKKVVVKSTGHPATFRKMRCPKCSLGYAVQSNVDTGVYQCGRCGHSFTSQPL